MTSGPNANEEPDTTGSTVPPYEGRKESADVKGQEESTKDGAKTAGATGLVEDDEAKAPEPSETERGATASPADEQPAEDTSDATVKGDDLSATGPAHESGVGRGEDKS